jgi:hypothetical protein
MPTPPEIGGCHAKEGVQQRPTVELEYQPCLCAEALCGTPNGTDRVLQEIRIKLEWRRGVQVRCMSGFPEVDSGYHARGAGVQRREDYSKKQLKRH